MSREKVIQRDSKRKYIIKMRFIEMEITRIDEKLGFKRVDIKIQIRDLCYSQKKTKGVCIMPRGPKRSALEVNKEKLAAVEEKLAKLEETVKALKAEKKN